MHSRSKPFPVAAAVVAVVAVALAACGGGSKTYKAGTPAVTGQAPDCSVVPLDLVTKTLKLELTGPVAEPKTQGDGWVCTFSRTRGGFNAVEQVQLTGNATKETFALARDAYKLHNNKVNTIKGWGDEAYATTVLSFEKSNNFAVRKGKVAVLITSTAEYDDIRKLMKEILAKV